MAPQRTLSLPIASPQYVPNRYRRRSKRTSPRRPYRAALLAFTLVLAVVWLSHLLDRPLSTVAATVRHDHVAAVAASSEGGQLGVAGLARGACWAFPPTAGGRGRTIFLDPGHGGPDPGASGYAVEEKQATLGVALSLARLLRADGWRVVLARTADSSVTRLTGTDLDAGAMVGSALRRDLLTRIACANAAHADALVSIHFNGFDDPSVGGTETFYDPDRPFSGSSLRLAQALQAALVTELGEDDRGVVSDADLDAATITNAGAAYGHLVELGPPMPGWVDTPSAMPGALVEPLFVTDPKEAVIAASAAGQQRIAQALLSGLRSYLG